MTDVRLYRDGSRQARGRVMRTIEFTSDRIDRIDGWSRACRVNGADFQVSVRRGKSVRIPYKPRGQNRGWHWHGAVYSGGRCLWSDRVPGSLGVRGLLIEAGVIEP